MNNTISAPPGYNFFQSIGRTIKQVRDPIGSMEESMARFNGTYSVSLGMARFIATQDPALIDHVLRGNHRNYTKSSIQTDHLGRFLGRGLLTSNGEYWLRQRRLIQPGFHTEKIHALYSIMHKTIDDFLVTIPMEREVDVYPFMNKLAFQIVINTLFNVNVSEQVQNELSTLILDIQDFVIRDLREVYKRWWHRISGEDRRHVEKAMKLRSIIRDMITTRRKENRKYNDLLDMLLEARYEDNGEGMNDEQLIDEITILIIAGHETTANALAWTLFLLAKDADVQQRLYSEIARNSIPDVVQSDYANAVIKESMRLYPPAWISDRECLEDDEFNSFLIPKGTIVVAFYYGLHRDKKWWKDADSFLPERFLKENFDPKSKIYYPFGAGPRLCIGNNFAMAEMVIFLKRFSESFIVEPGSRQPRINPLVTLKPDHVFLRLRRRK
jgi:cytochrome P450